MDFLLLYVLPMLVMLGVLISVHELGHYVAARAFGVSVDTFAVGFGPRLFGRVSRATGTDWCLRAVPLGGYVKFALDETQGRKLDGVALTGLAKWKRIVILVAGPLVNLAVAPVLFYTFILVSGIQVSSPEVGRVLDGSPAAEAGIESGDILLSVNGRDAGSMEALSSVTRTALGGSVQTTWRTDEGVVTHTLTPEVREIEIAGRTGKIGLVGVASQGVKTVHPGPIGAVGEAASMTVERTSGILTTLWQMVSGQRGVDELMGVVGVGHISGEVAQNAGVGGVIGLMGLLSLSLGIINLMPIPVLDGGQISVLLWEGATGRPITPRVEDVLAKIGLGAVALLFLVTLWNDVAAIINVASSSGA